MKRIQDFAARHSAPPLSRSLGGLWATLRGLVLLLWLPWPAMAVADAVLETADVRVEPGNQIQISLNFSGTAPEAKAFVTSGPDRLVVDLPGAKNGLKQRTLPIQSSAASSLTAIEASDRTRVVVNLNSALPYDVTTRGNQVLVNVYGGSIPPRQRHPRRRPHPWRSARLRSRPPCPPRPASRAVATSCVRSTSAAVPPGRAAS